VAKNYLQGCPLIEKWILATKGTEVTKTGRKAIYSSSRDNLWWEFCERKEGFKDQAKGMGLKAYTLSFVFFVLYVARKILEVVVSHKGHRSHKSWEEGDLLVESENFER
jgi:hypothetical protein